MRFGKKLTAALVVAAALVVSGGTGAALAATASTSISVWYQGTSGSWRAATTSSQAIKFNTSCYGGVHGSVSFNHAQMQLQRQNGILAPISEGNKNVGCSSGSSQSWGPRVKGINYRYQFNGASTGSGSLFTGPFTVDSVTITY